MKPKTAVDTRLIRNELGKLKDNPIGLELVRNEVSLLRQDIFRSLFDSRRDLNFECGYPERITLNMMQGVWERDGIGAKLISVWPDESWQLYPEIIEGEQADDTDFEESWKKINKYHNLNNQLHIADKISGIGQFGVLLLGINDGRELSQPVEGVTDAPLDEREGPGVERKLLFVRAFSQSNVQIDSLETNSKNPRFGKPLIYKVQWQDNTMGDADQIGNNIAKQVHWSRIIHIADNRTSSPTWGIPRLQRTFNNIYNIQKVLGGSGEMFWKGGFPGFSFEINPDIKGDVEFDDEKFRRQLEAYSNGMQRYLTLLNMNAKSLATSIADPTPHLMVQLNAICAAEGLPMRIFLGTEAARLAGSQDERAWTNRVKFRQQNYLTPSVIRPLINRLLECGILPWVEGGEFNVVWPDIAAPSDMDKADISSKEVQAVAAYISGGCEAIMPPEQFFLQIMRWSQEKVDAVMEAAKEFIESSAMDRLQEIKGNVPEQPDQYDEEETSTERYSGPNGSKGTIEKKKSRRPSMGDAQRSARPSKPSRGRR